jgi:hypothetical protein
MAHRTGRVKPPQQVREQPKVPRLSAIIDLEAGRSDMQSKTVESVPTASHTALSPATATSENNELEGSGQQTDSCKENDQSEQAWIASYDSLSGGGMILKAEYLAKEIKRAALLLTMERR